jgi:hypothetical protein
MKRVAALLTVLLAALVAGSVGEPVAFAKEQPVFHATAALAVVGSEIEQPKLVWIDPQTLKRLKRGSVSLPGASSVIMSPSRTRVAAGSAGRGLQIVDVTPLKLLRRVATRPGWSVHPITWPTATRLLALEWNDRSSRQAFVVVDPVSRRVVRRVAVDGYSSWQAAGRDVVLLGRPGDGIGPASLVVVDREGNARTVLLERIQAGGQQEGTDEEPTWRTASPGLAVDPAIGHAYVVGQEALVAAVDLATLAVTYHEPARPRSMLGRFLDWLQPAAHGKIVNGWHRQAVSLGGGKLAVSGSDYDRTRRSPAGLELVDVRAATMRRLEGRASYTMVASGMLLVGGDASSGDGDWTGMGLAAYTLEGDKLWHVLEGEPVSWLQSVGGYAYVVGEEAYPQTVRVVDLADGSVRTVRGQLPMFVSP